MYEIQNNDLKWALPIGITKHYGSNGRLQTFSCANTAGREEKGYRE